MEKIIENIKHKQGERHPPNKSNYIVSDVWNFLINKPKQPTYIKFRTFQDRQNFSHRILQRVGLDASHYSVLNVHQIGVNAPANYLFEELLSWNGDSSCWPNHIAKVDRIDNKLEKIQILPFGKTKYPFGIKNGILGFKYIPLFNLNALKIQSVPDSAESDNARYLLYDCTGGYPIGFFSMYVRSSIAEQNEKEQSQLFFAVGFDFFGKKKWKRKHFIVWFWSAIHNRVTSNVMNRLKQLCEWRFEKIQKG